MLVTLAAAAVLASSAFAQSLNISSTCTNTLESIATSSDGTCLNAAGLLNFATTGNNTSLISPLNSWLTGVCTQQACSNQTLANIVGNITSGCASDLEPLGFSSSDTSSITSDVQQFYPTVREIVCLKNTTSNSLCVTDLLTTVQSSVGTLSESNLPNIVLGLFSGSTTSQLSSALTSLECSNCVKATYNIIQKNFGDLLSSDDKSNLTATCGSGFTDGTNPSSVSQTAAGLSSSSNTASGALGSFPMTSLAVSLSALASAFAFFA